MKCYVLSDYDNRPFLLPVSQDLRPRRSVTVYEIPEDRYNAWRVAKEKLSAIEVEINTNTSRMIPEVLP